MKIGRKAVAIDLDPMAIFITKTTAMPVNLNKVEEVFLDIKKDIKSEIDKLYLTKCTKCNKKAIIQHIVFEKSEPISIRFKCLNCGVTSNKSFSEEDKENEINIEMMRIPYWYPNNELIWNSRVNVKRGTKVSDLFSKRNIIALSIIYHKIDEINDENIKNAFKFIFSSMLSQASKMLVYTKGQGPGWKVRGFWIPENRYEMNVWNFFKNRYLKFVRGKSQSNEAIEDLYKEGKVFSDLLNDKNILFSQQSALDLSNIPTESIDYVFTDPPYGDAIPYLELDYFWSSWLQFSPNFEDEIIISDSPIRHKNFDEYYRMLIQAFKEIFRVLKSDKWMTVTFHSTDIEIYNSIIRAIAFAGFELEKIIYQYPAKASAKAQLAPYGSAIGDYYLRFKKPLRKRELQSEESIDMARFEFVVVDSIKKIIADRGEPTTYNDILKGIYPKLDEYGYLLVAKPEKIENIIKKYEDEEFIFVDGEGWWFKDPSKYWLHIVPLQDRVEKTIIQVLHSEFRASFDEILQKLFENFPNALTPSPPSIKAILEEYAKQTPDGKWQLIQKTIERERA